MALRTNDPPTYVSDVNGHSYTYVPNVRPCQASPCVVKYLGASLFQEFDVEPDGNCLFYVYQLFIEWSGQGGYQLPQPVAVIRKQLREYLVSKCGLPDYFQYLISRRLRTVAAEIYNTYEVDDNYYNRPDGVLPSFDWGDSETLSLLAAQHHIKRVVIFTEQSVQVTTLCYKSSNGLTCWKLNGCAFADVRCDTLRLRSDGAGTEFSRNYLDYINPEIRRNAYDTLYIVFTGDHYHWLKPNFRNRSQPSYAMSLTKMQINKDDQSKKRKAVNDEEGDAEVKKGCCYVCTAKEPNVACYPCGHVVMCDQCFDDCVEAEDYDHEVDKKRSECVMCGVLVKCMISLRFG
jgi:hypothetical protein